MLVIHDELDLPFGKLQLKQGGGSGGHNGLKSISETLGDGYARLRFGIGKPDGPNAKERVSGYVLSDFRGEERKQLDDQLILATQIVEAWVRDGMAKAMNRYNKR